MADARCVVEVIRGARVGVEEVDVTAGHGGAVARADNGEGEAVDEGDVDVGSVGVGGFDFGALVVEAVIVLSRC